MIEVAHPWVLLLLVPALLIGLRAVRRPARQTGLRHPFLKLMPPEPGWRVRAVSVLPWLGIIALLLLVMAASRPRIAHQTEEVEGEGIDIVVALDISGSMLALDFEPDDRITVAKNVIDGFIEGRVRDRIGLVLFAGKAFTQCPLTVDRSVLRGFLDEVEVGLIEDGTAIGFGLATAVNRLKHSQAESKVVILLTDGMNNIPTLEPETAAGLAEALGIRVYTIGVGREGYAPYPVDDPMFGRRVRQIESHIDEALLKRISAQTGGQMFRAQDPEALATIFSTIDELERTRFETHVSTFYRELAGWLMLPALILLLAEGILALTALRRLP